MKRSCWIGLQPHKYNERRQPCRRTPQRSEAVAHTSERAGMKALPTQLPHRDCGAEAAPLPIQHNSGGEHQPRRPYLEQPTSSRAPRPAPRARAVLWRAIQRHGDISSSKNDRSALTQVNGCGGRIAVSRNIAQSVANGGARDIRTRHSSSLGSLVEGRIPRDPVFFRSNASYRITFSNRNPSSSGRSLGPLWCGSGCFALKNSMILKPHLLT